MSARQWSTDLYPHHQEARADLLRFMAAPTPERSDPLDMSDADVLAELERLRQDLEADFRRQPRSLAELERLGRRVTAIDRALDAVLRYR